jgi:hypothetical protein
MGLALAAFLVVGLIISTKIGGGGDLHNLDMFLIGLLFTAGVVWQKVGQETLAAPSGFPSWARIAVVVTLALPAYQPLMALRPLQFQQDAAWLSVLADVERARDLGSLPSDETALESLQQLRNEVQQAKSTGDVLFMDQRQLLTFGQVSDVRLISSYEKKRMMDEALSGNAAYFRRFYEDSDAQRYWLIVSSLLRTPIKDSEYGFEKKTTPG